MPRHKPPTASGYAPKDVALVRSACLSLATSVGSFIDDLVIVLLEKSGEVSRVRVEAPQLLQRNNFTRCARTVVTGLHFPSSGGANVVTYPFEIK